MCVTCGPDWRGPGALDRLLRVFEYTPTAEKELEAGAVTGRTVRFTHLLCLRHRLLNQFTDGEVVFPPTRNRSSRRAQFLYEGDTDAVS